MLHNGETFFYVFGGTDTLLTACVPLMRYTFIVVPLSNFNTVVQSASFQSLHTVLRDKALTHLALQSLKESTAIFNTGEILKSAKLIVTLTCQHDSQKR